MTDQNKNINLFTAKDFERYYSGKMSPHEMHLLEKAALEDPFLEDALEGYKLTATPVKDIAALQTELNSRTDKGKIIPFQRKWNPAILWKVAAMILLTAGLGWAIYTLSFVDSSNDIAVTSKPPPKRSESNTIAAPREQTVTTIAAPADTPNTATLSAPEIEEKNVDKGAKQSGKQKKDDGAIASFSNSKPNEDNVETIAAPKDVMPRASAPANIETDSNTNTSVVTGYGTQKRSAAQKNIIVLEKAKETEMQEVVIGHSKRDTNYQKHRVSFEEVEPVNGIGYYNDYVLQNLQLPEKESLQKPAGEVKLSFDINDMGHAININVEKSLCRDCDLEAIRLLKEGPKFLKKKTKKGKLVIHF